MRYTVSWSAQDILDLNSADATFVRAFHESSILANYVGGADNAYPGFEDAITPEIEEVFYKRRWPHEHVYGKEFNRILEVTELIDDKVQVLACQVRPYLFPDTPISTPPTPGAGSVAAFRLVYQRQGDPPPEDQHGSRQVPHGSVFGDWQALEYDPHLEIYDREVIAPCLSINYQPQETDSAEPGWPEGPQPAI